MRAKIWEAAGGQYRGEVRHVPTKFKTRRMKEKLRCCASSTVVVLASEWAGLLGQVASRSPCHPHTGRWRGVVLPLPPPKLPSTLLAPRPLPLAVSLRKAEGERSRGLKGRSSSRAAAVASFRLARAWESRWRTTRQLQAEAAGGGVGAHG